MNEIIPKVIHQLSVKFNSWLMENTLPISGAMINLTYKTSLLILTGKRRKFLSINVWKVLMRHQQTFPLFLIAAFLLFYCSTSFAAPAGSCIICHTNESLMKTLHKPVPIPASEGEG
jgi:hypothetical protein